MLADLCVVPLGAGSHTSPVLAAVLKVVKDSGLPYQLTSTSTSVEGTLSDIGELVRRCHATVGSDCAHFVICLRLEEDNGEMGRLQQNIESVEREGGEAFATHPDEANRGTRARGLSPEGNVPDERPADPGKN